MADMETAARELCKMRGQDPDEPAIIPQPNSVQASIKRGPRWRVAAVEIRTWMEVRDAVRMIESARSMY